MTALAIEVDRLGKEYAVGSARRVHSTFYDLVTETLRSPLRRLRAGAELHDDANRFWALRDVSFSVSPGDALGIIGRNGAGKSTLLKILSRVTYPTTGRATIRGRVGSLLEVGTGFHPELTGRENVFLNGAILGMKRSEIEARFDEIVEFSEVAKFIDTPVKRYSSGMTVRLAFAVAAHLEPDVLIADEVLAVGDMAFQRKSLGKMEDAARHGRTVLFVSHNLGAVRNLCRSVLVIESGRLQFQGPVEKGVALYESGMSSALDSIAHRHFQGPLSDRLRFEEIVSRQGGEVVAIVDPLRETTIEVRGAALRTFPTLELSVGLFREGVHVASCHDAPRGSSMKEGAFLSRFHISPEVLKPGRYVLGLGAVAASGDWTWGSDVSVLDVAEKWVDDSAARDRGLVGLRYTAERVQ